MLLILDTNTHENTKAVNTALTSVTHSLYCQTTGLRVCLSHVLAAMFQLDMTLNV